MRQKIFALVIVLGTGLLVWAIMAMDRLEQGNAPEVQDQTKPAMLVGQVTLINGNRVKFRVGDQEFMIRVTDQTEITKKVAVVGKWESSPGVLADIMAGSRITVEYRVDATRGPSEPIIEFDADKIEVRP